MNDLKITGSTFSNNIFIKLLKEIKHLIIKFAVITFAIFILAFLVSIIVRPSIFGLLNWADDKGIGVSKTPLDKFFQYIINNGIKVPMQMFILSIIPIPFLYYLPVALTAAVTGFMFYLPFSSDLQGKLVFSDILLDILPHSLIEILAFFILLAIQYQLNEAIRYRVFKHKPLEEKWSNILKKAFLSYLLAFPIFVFAA